MIPKSIKILGQEWKIKEAVKKMERASIYGLCVYEERTIYIYKKMNIKNKINTLNHEIAHALFLQSGIYFASGISSEMEEVFCEAFSNFMEQSSDYLKWLSDNGHTTC